MTEGGVITIIDNAEHDSANYSNTNDIDEDLIGIVREKRALYDHRIAVEERTKPKKDALWEEVSNCLNAYTADQAQKRWTYLRECFVKARKQYQTYLDTHKRSGAPGTPKGEIKKPSFRHFESMSFLDDVLKHKTTVSSIIMRKSSNASVAVDTNGEIDIENVRPSTSNFGTNRNAMTPSPVQNVPIDRLPFNDIMPSPTPSPTSFVAPMPLTSPTDRSSCTSTSSNNRLQLPSRPESAPDLSSSRRRRNSSRSTDDIDAEILTALNRDVQQLHPVDGFTLRLGEGMKRLSYDRRSRLEIRFLSLLYEAELEEHEKQTINN